MKKTLIALVALSGLAMADTYSTLDITSSYVPENDYTLTLTMGNGATFGGSSYMLTTEVGFNVFCQIGRYFGVEKDGGQTDVSGTNFYGETPKDVIVGETEGWFVNLNGNYRTESTVLTLNGNFEADTTTVTITNDFMDTPFVLNVNKFIDPTTVKYNSTKAPNLSAEFTCTPEPATATLSLLALAGLASRRRRH